jgi:tRNA(Ile)-lysidine synthase
MHPLAADVRRTIARDNLIPAGASVLVAVSGGADSVALLHLLREIAPLAGFGLAGIAHLHHGLRGAAADADEAFVAALASSLALPLHLSRMDVRRLAASWRTGLEDAARRARYEFLEASARDAGADRIAVGHTRDDQAETLLLQLIRGAGPRGLGGIHARAGLVVRPLLEVPREALRQYLGGRGLEWREDETNRDPALLRNRVRHELVPYLERRFSPGIVRVLAREAALARADGEYLDRAAAAAAGWLVRVRDQRVEVDTAGLLAEPAAVASRVARLALIRAAPGRFIGYDHVAALLRFAAQGPTGGRLRLPGAWVVRQGPRLRLGPPDEPAGGREANSFRVLLSIPGEAPVPAASCTVSAARVDWPAAGLSRADGTLAVPREVAVVDAAALSPVLVVRGRAPGDRFAPLGLGGRKKLHDFFVDRKVPRQARDLVPLVVDDRDRIVWVAGHAIAEEFRVSERTEAVVILKLQHWSNRA